MLLYIFLLGTIIGSFLNVCIYRIPKRESIIFPPSYCHHCNTSLRRQNLIPIFSFFFQRGKCSYCNAGISLHYPLVELLNGLLYLFLYNKFGLTLDFILLAMVFSTLIVISLIDIRYQIIPDILNITILITGLVYKILEPKINNLFLDLVQSLLGLILSSLIFLLIIFISKGGMGGGDLKLMAALGFILGIRKAILTIFLSFVIGGIISLILLFLRIKDIKDPIPFGPFISTAFMITVFWGERIVNWYITKFFN